MANDIFILVSHHHWEQATKPLHIWCEQNWNLDQVLSARGVSPDWIYFSLFNAIAGGMRNNRNWERFLIILDSLWYFEIIYTFPSIQFSQQTFVELEIIEFIVFHLWCRIFKNNSWKIHLSSHVKRFYVSILKASFRLIKTRLLSSRYITLLPTYTYKYYLGYSAWCLSNNVDKILQF